MRNRLLYSFVLMLIINIASAQQWNTNLGTNTQSTGGGTGLTVVGYSAGLQSGSTSEINSSYNSFYGYKAGYRHTGSNSDNNTFIGAESGGNASPSLKETSNNTFIGYRSGYLLYTGSGKNVFLGANAGYSVTSGAGNVFLGYNAGYSETGSNKLYIDNSNTATPLIYGDFDLNRVGINVLPSTYTLNVGGAINATGLFVNGTAVSLGVTTVSPWTLDGNAVNYNNGNVGIGIVSNVPAYKLDVNGTINATGYLLNGAALPSTQWTTSGGTIYYSGNVGIGTTSPGSFKLAVEGKIGAREVQVTTASPWPDYVFAPKYEPLSLSQVEHFIKTNGHLPEIPSAQQIKAEGGHELGQMDVLLLKKIEELTLYLIDQNKEIEKLQSEISNLKKVGNKQGEQIRGSKNK